MSLSFEELDFRQTPLGDLLLRRRRMPQFGDLDIYEVKLGDDFLMSSLFHEAERQLSKLGLGVLEKDEIDVVVGGLGLGYTAVSALEDSRVTSLVVVDYLEAVIEWHQRGLVPLGNALTEDSRCRLVHADFFALSRNFETSFDPNDPAKKHDAILLDIDHTPTNLLNLTNDRFYSEEGLGELARHLNPGGVFAIWADGEPEASFTEHLGKVFAQAEAQEKALDLMLDDAVTASDLVHLLVLNAVEEPRRRRLHSWLESNLPVLRTKIPSAFVASVVSASAGADNREALNQALEFYRSQPDPNDVLKRESDKVEEQALSRIRATERGQEAFDAFIEQ